MTADFELFVGMESAPPRVARDAVNEVMIRHWCDAVGDTNPIYLDQDAAAAGPHGCIVAPPTMMQAWTMPGLRGHDTPDAETPFRRLLGALDEAGFTSIVATNCEQSYERYLQPGDLLTERTVIEDVSDEKTTGLGTGRFITLSTTYTDQAGYVVGTMRFRVLKFKPAARATEPAPARPKPARSADTSFFWEGAQRGELLIQRCAACGTLRHPPGPGCAACGSLDWDTVRSAGRGTVFSYAVHHYPPIPGFDYPLVIGLVELDEGTRLVSNLVGVEPDDVEIGMLVEVVFEEFGDELTLPVFRAVR